MEWKATQTPREVEAQGSSIVEWQNIGSRKRQQGEVQQAWQLEFIPERQNYPA